ncbi:NADPH-dependent FMN reductase [Peribacillus sp. SCS-26]|uniref:NADPH-dependent FMN reductase n=1 Tax=Paraperibacillus marinus TaxID=3115295 RepID=UPI003905D8F4
MSLLSKIVIVSGSPVKDSRLNGIMNFAVDYLEGKGADYEVLHVRDLPAEDLIGGAYDSEEIVKASGKVTSADKIIILTPVYKASFTGVLKTFLDLLPMKGLEDKTILPLAIGGTYGHLLMIDYALKPVLASLGATHILKGVFTLDQQVQRAGDNVFELDNDAEQRLQAALEKLLP